MAKYINKDALVAEIERRLNYRVNSLKAINNGTFWKEGQSEDEFNESLTRCAFNAAKNELFELKCFTDTLEVKEVQEEPVSEELEEAADNALNKVLNNHEIVNIRSCLEMFKYGANWQKEQFEKNRLAACDAQTKEEAEKDLELTWDDIHAISIIEDKLIHELCLNDQTLPNTQEFYEEVLKRFKTKKEESC